MIDPREKYEAALADFARPGNRNATQGRLSYWGKASGLTAEEIISDARAAGVRDRDADIRSGWNKWEVKGDRAIGQRRRVYTPKPKPKPAPTFPRYVRDMVAAGGGEATCRDLLALSPFHAPVDGRAQTAAFLRELYRPDDILHVTRKITKPDDEDEITFLSAKPGKTLKPVREWLAQLERGEALPGDYVVPNPFTGERGKKTDGGMSYAAQSCLARFPFAEVEFDDMPLKVQAAFWRGLLTTSPLAPMVASITFSGDRSLHGLLYVGADSELDWRKMVYYKDEFGQERGRLRGLLATDPEHFAGADEREHWPFRADPMGMRPRQATRLPGVHRIAADGTRGMMQSLLYLNPGAVRTTAKPCAGAMAADVGARHRDAARRRMSAFVDCAEPHAPTMPPADGPLDDILAALDAAECWEAAQPFNQPTTTSRKEAT